MIAPGTAPPETVQTEGNAAEEVHFCQQLIARLCSEGYVLKSAFSFGTDNQANLVFKGQ